MRHGRRNLEHEMSSFPPVVEPSSLNGSNGFKINGQAAYDQSGFSVASAGDVNGDGSAGFKTSGETAYDNSGFSVASAGDVNGDGFADLIIGAPGVAS